MASVTASTPPAAGRKYQMNTDGGDADEQRHPEGGTTRSIRSLRASTSLDHAGQQVASAKGG